jgi:hypothetical protein
MYNGLINWRNEMAKPTEQVLPKAKYDELYALVEWVDNAPESVVKALRYESFFNEVIDTKIRLVGKFADEKYFPVNVYRQYGTLMVVVVDDEDHDFDIPVISE